jgi:HD-GYP domain-containing protein (c-di-GMP phosphodiesterase class II)
MRIEHVKAGMVLAEDILDEHGHLLLEKGIALTESYLSRMRSLGIRSLSIADAYANSLKLTTAITSQLREELSLCFRALFHLKSEELLAQKLRTVYIRQLNSTVDSVITQMEGQLHRIINVQVRTPSTTEVEHAVNVCLLSVITGLYLRFPRAVLQELALGALLHDIGKSLVPQNAQAPSNPEFHCLAGQSLLMRSGVGSVIARIAAEHHEYYDGSGYPAKITNTKIHPLSRIVAVSNYFDSAISQANEDGTPRHEVMERLLASGNIHFDLNVLRAFCHTVAIYPIGSLVKLSSGEFGYVVENQTQFPLRPVVRIFQSGNPTDINLVFKPQIIIEELIQE